MRQKTEQELFWEGSFGTEYTQRNQGFYQERQPFFAEILKLTEGIRSVCELGANSGQNLRAIGSLDSKMEMVGVEINSDAYEELKTVPGVQSILSSIQEVNINRTFDLTYTCGVLIHINPDDLSQVYDKLYQLSARYILINEYYNPVPVEVSYRGNDEKLFKRDFAGEFLDRFNGKLRIVSYGFLWKRLHPAWDDTTWVLMEKCS